MICQHCDEYFFIYEVEKELATHNYNFQLAEIEEYVTDVKLDRMICTNCGAVLEQKEYYFEDDDFDYAKEIIFKNIAEKASSDIESCENCTTGHGGLIGAMRHSAHSIFTDEGEDPDRIVDDMDVYSEVWDLINYSDFCLEYGDQILNFIYCPSCVSEACENSYIEELQSYSKVYTSKNIRDFEKSFYGVEYDEIQKEIDKISEICTESELNDLRNKYLENQAFIYEQSAFGKIYSMIKDMYDNDNYFALANFKNIFRVRTNENKKCYINEEMWEPSVEESYQGRYNTTGFPVLYCGNSKEVVEKEVPLEQGKIHNYVEFRVNKEFRMFRSNYAFRNGFEGFIQESTDGGKCAFKNEYIITNILADIVKRVGYDGVVYVSTKDERFMNYAFFRFNRNDDIIMTKVYY